MSRSNVVALATGLLAVAAGVLVVMLPAGPWEAPDGFLATSPDPATTTAGSIAGSTVPATVTTTPATPTAETSTTTTTAAPATTTPTAETSTTTPATTTSTTTSTPPTTAPPTTPPPPTTAPTPVDRSALIVVVANANGVAGIAGATSADLVAAGYASVTPTDALERATATVVYLRDGLQLEAERLVADLGWDGVGFAPLDQLPEIESTGEFDLVLLIGLDRA